MVKPRKKYVYALILGRTMLCEVIPENVKSREKQPSATQPSGADSKTSKKDT